MHALTEHVQQYIAKSKTKIFFNVYCNSPFNIMIITCIIVSIRHY